MLGGGSPPCPPIKYVYASEFQKVQIKGKSTLKTAMYVRITYVYINVKITYAHRRISWGGRGGGRPP